MPMTLLVTGGAGFIGSHLVQRLLDEDHRVRVLDNFATGHRQNIQAVIDEIELIEGDLQSYERVNNAVRGCELVFHLGALPSVPRSVQDPLTSNASNVVGTLNVLLAARDEDVKRVVYASSSSVYGASDELPQREEMPSLPIAPYAVSKLAGEGYCRAFNRVYGLETVSLRYFNVFGPRQDPRSQYAAVIPNFVSAVLAGEPLVIHGDGEQSRDFTYVDNAVDANLLAAGAEGATGETLNVACGTSVSLNEIVAQLGELSGTEVDAVHDEPRPGDIRHSLADVSRAREVLGYEPAIDFDEGLRRTYQDMLLPRDVLGGVR
ncbi:MAG TPA: SDR family oxidoreductase [Solirubrobacterales bacterium]|jgi:nucleoside-diphosphate-sugar epimerase|nr:SDR family oxidoreductase [Solirubrobacterales bacterium]